MANSVFLAKLIGPICTLVALSFLLNRQNYQKLIEDFLSNEGIKYLGGFLAFLVGLLIVNTHNVWEASWVVIITIVGWMGIIKGIFYFLYPDKIKEFAQAYQQRGTLLKVQLSLTLIFGLFLIYKGYF